MGWAEEGVPNPGSDAAMKQGCECAVLDNCHGKFAPYPPDGWWITMGCPLHAPTLVVDDPSVCGICEMSPHSPQCSKQSEDYMT